MNVLNPRLYEALELRYRHVGIVNPGQEARIDYRPNYAGGKVRLSAEVNGGEYYKVNCLRCGDTRQRLCFNYLWGKRDPRTKQQLLHLAICFNEDCLESWADRKQLYDALYAGLRRKRRMCRFISASASTDVAEPPSPRKISPPKKISLPKGCVPLYELDLGHHAREYLQLRDFDVDELWRLWRVRYCHRDPMSSPPTYDRIVVPVYHRKNPVAQRGSNAAKWQLAGWQSRIVDGPHDSDIPKYLTAAGMSKSSLLYGLPHALHDDGPVAITEGVTDVWRLGRNSVATFGKSMSTLQQNLIVSLFEGRPLVVAYDQDAVEENRKVCTLLRNARLEFGDRSPVSTIRLPSTANDLGECDREAAWTLVSKAVSR